MGAAGGAALVATGADHLISFQLDEGLQHELHRLPQEVQVAAGAQGVEQFGQSRLVEGHRVIPPTWSWAGTRRRSRGGPSQGWTPKNQPLRSPRRLSEQS